MARSKGWRIVAFVVLAGGLPLVVACNDLIGLSDYKRGECSGGAICTDAGLLPPVVATSKDASDDAPSGTASGTKPVRWAHFVMPNYPQDGGPGKNVPTYSVVQGSVVDSMSKLTWLQAVAPLDTYENAQSYCANKSGGWRLPSRIELVTLLDLTPHKSVAIDTTAFPSAQANEYWTTSEVRPDVDGKRAYWTVDFKNGGVNHQDAKTGTAGVRCIKDQ